jgi:hypothetical protein
MKKLVILVLFLSLGLGVVIGCGGSGMPPGQKVAEKDKH